MQNNLHVSVPGGAPGGNASLLEQAYGLQVADLLGIQPAGMWRQSLMNVLRGYLYACMAGDQCGEFDDASDLIELVDFFEKLGRTEISGDQPE